MEGLRDAGFQHCVALYYRLVHPRPSRNIITLDSKKFLKRVCGAIALKCPDLHFAEPLSAELSLTPKRLLGDKRIRSNRPGVYLVIDQMVQFQHIGISHSNRSFKGLASLAVIQDCLSCC